MNIAPSEQPKPLKSPAVEGLRTLLIFGLFLLMANEVVKALLTGRTKFPIRYNYTYVTVTGNPGWFVASVVALLLMSAFLAYISRQCWKRFVSALRR